MTLPNILKLTDDIKACYFALVSGKQHDIPIGNRYLRFDARVPVLDSMSVEARMQAKMQLMTMIARERLGPPGGPAPVEGGSFDWEVAPVAGGDVHFIIKSYTDQQTLERLRAQYAHFTTHPLMDNSYDFR